MSELPTPARREWCSPAAPGTASVLGADEVGPALSPALSYLRHFGARFVASLCSLPGVSEASRPPVLIPGDSELAAIAAAVPPMTRAEDVTTEILADLWCEPIRPSRPSSPNSKPTAQEFLRSRNKAWNLVGRVHFNLAENRKDAEAPFAFLATYTHAPLGPGASRTPAAWPALREYAGAAKATACSAGAGAARRRATAPG